MILPLFSDIKGLKRYFVSNLSSLFCPHCLHNSICNCSCKFDNFDDFAVIIFYRVITRL